MFNKNVVIVIVIVIVVIIEYSYVYQTFSPTNSHYVILDRSSSSLFATTPLGERQFSHPPPLCERPW